MPTRPKIPCKHTGCNKLVPHGQKYCEIHVPLHKPSAKDIKAKGYDSKWRKARARYLTVHPLCVRCLKEDKLVKASVVDHINPHRGDKKLFWDESNWQALCKHHHDQKTMTEDRYLEYKY